MLKSLRILLCKILLLSAFASPVFSADAIIIDHNCTDITQIPQSAIEQAKTSLHIAYGHTSHGSQLTTGMTGLVAFANGGGLGLSLPTDIFKWNNGGTGGALDLRDSPFSGASDLGNPNRTAWATATRSYLNAQTDVNVIIWSWCGQADGTKEQIDQYLDLMSSLETDYPDVKFVYMTGHTNGTGLTGNLHQRNMQIRAFCEANGKILYDFEDIESYDPDGEYFGDRNVTDTCAYNGGNWAIEWQNAHAVGVDWYSCTSQHSQPLNANRKAYAAWWLWARLAGWNPAQVDLCPDDPYKTEPGVCGCGTPDRDTDEDGIMDCIDPEIKESFPWELFYPAFMKNR